MKTLKRIDNSRFSMEIRRTEYQKEEIISTRPIANNDNLYPIKERKKNSSLITEDYISQMEMIDPEKADELKIQFLKENYNTHNNGDSMKKKKKINEPIPYGGDTQNESKVYNHYGSSIGINIRRS